MKNRLFFRLDFDFYKHRKFIELRRRAGPIGYLGAKDLWEMIGCLSVRDQTFGIISLAMLMEVCPKRETRVRRVEHLCAVDLLRPQSKGVWAMPDWEERNPGPEQIAESKALKAARDARHYANKKAKKATARGEVPTARGGTHGGLQRTPAVGHEKRSILPNSVVLESVRRVEQELFDAYIDIDRAPTSAPPPPEVLPASPPHRSSNLVKAHGDGDLSISGAVVVDGGAFDLRRLIDFLADARPALTPPFTAASKHYAAVKKACLERPFTYDEVEAALAQARQAKGNPNGGLVAFKLLENRASGHHDTVINARKFNATSNPATQTLKRSVEMLQRLTRKAATND